MFGYSVRILKCAESFAHSPWKRRSHQQRGVWIIVANEEANGGMGASNEEDHSALPPRQCIMSQVNENDGQVERTTLWTTFPPSVFFRSALLLLATTNCSLKNAFFWGLWAPRKGMCFKWRGRQRNGALFWSHSTKEVSICSRSAGMSVWRLRLCKNIDIIDT